jgi:hypothetical protein
MRVYMNKHTRTIYRIPVCTGSEIEKWGSMEFENLHYVTVEIEREREQPEYDGRINYVNEQPYDEE